MKKVLQISESNLISMINRIVEQVSLDHYDDEDFTYVALVSLKDWLLETHNIDLNKYPLSYILNKYINEFAKYHDIEPSYRGGLYRLSHLGRALAMKEKVKLPSLRKEKGFLETYKKGVDFFVKRLNLPDFLELHLSEANPYNVTGKLVADFQEMLKSPRYLETPSTLEKKFQRFFQDFLGVDMGNPTHGDLSFYLNGGIEYTGKDPWIKYEFDKNLKKEIRSDPQLKKAISRIKLEIDSSRFVVKIILYLGNSFRWDTRAEILKKAKDVLEKNGYNLDVLQVEMN